MRATIGRLRHNVVFEVALTVAVAVGLAVAVQAYAVKPYRIPSGSMEPTLDVGQRVVVDRLSHRLGSSPAVGDIVVFRPPAGAADDTCADRDQGVGTRYPCGAELAGKDPRTFIKRVVAVGGDTIAIRDGHAVRNGERASEPFILPCKRGADCDYPRPITVPKGHVFVMGDNRGRSDDSRYWGPVPTSWIIGQAFATYWPLDRIGGL